MEKAPRLFDLISVNVETGEIAYPSLPGFELDVERVYRSAGRFAAYCNAEMAVRHAIHEQLAAHQGLRGLPL